MSNIPYAMKIAKLYYDENTFNHAIRVATYVAQNTMIPFDKMDFCFTLALMHDLEEDTEYRLCSASGLDDQERLEDCLDVLTKLDSEDYISYICRVKDYSSLYPELYWVKLADMKDHLAQTETLTDKLKKKYLDALPYLL